MSIYRGVRPRGNGIQIRFWIQGKQFSETLKMEASPTNLLLAKEIRDAMKLRALRGHDLHIDQAVVAIAATTTVSMDAAIAIAFRAARRRPGYELSQEDEAFLVQRSKYRCEVTGVPFSVGTFGKTRSPFAPSIDRIDSAKPYQRGNVRIVCVAANYAMNEWGQHVLETMCIAYLQNVICPQMHRFTGQTPVTAHAESRISDLTN